LRTDFAVMYACGIIEVQAERSQAHFVLPQTLAQFRSRLDEALMDELLAIQAAWAIDEGLVSPAPLLVDTFPAEQGTQRVTDASALYKAQKKSSSSLRTLPRKASHKRRGAEKPGRTSPPRPQAGHAPFRPPVSWPRQSALAPGTRHGSPPARGRTVYRGPGTGRSGESCKRHASR
jgi:hypothetical protein